MSAVSKLVSIVYSYVIKNVTRFFYGERNWDVFLVLQIDPMGSGGIYFDALPICWCGLFITFSQIPNACIFARNNRLNKFQLLIELPEFTLYALNEIKLY